MLPAIFKSNRELAEQDRIGNFSIVIKLFSLVERPKIETFSKLF